MNYKLTNIEIEKIQKLCFSNPSKACAFAQTIIDTCQIISCSTYSSLKEKSKRNILYKASGMVGIKIEDRKFISLNQ